MVEAARSAAEDHMSLKELGFSRLTLVVKLCFPFHCLTRFKGFDSKTDKNNFVGSLYSIFFVLSFVEGPRTVFFRV